MRAAFIRPKVFDFSNKIVIFLVVLSVWITPQQKLCKTAAVMLFQLMPVVLSIL